MKSIVLAALLVFGLTPSLVELAAQKVPPPKDPDAALREFNERLKSVAESKGNGISQEQDYQIGPEDQIDITVFEVPELSRTVRVSAAGDISLPLIGSVKAAGKSQIGRASCRERV